jgi:hypothetical protein
VIAPDHGHGHLPELADLGSVARGAAALAAAFPGSTPSLQIQVALKTRKFESHTFQSAANISAHFRDCQN